MRRIAQIIRKVSPYRRRHWRYVSGRRRRRGILVMLGLILAVGAWWRFTNDAQVRRMADQYLSRRLPAAEVRIRDASFGLFEGITLTGVRVYGDDGVCVSDIFKAREVVLKFKPLASLLARRLVVTKIVCIEPELTITEDVDRRKWNVQALLGSGGRSAGAPPAGDLPRIQIHDGLVRRKEIVDGERVRLGAERISATAAPTSGGGYAITLSTDKPDASFAGRLELSPMAFTWKAGASAALLRRTAPRAYRRWLDAYQVRGRVRFEGRSDGDPARFRLAVGLEEVSFACPPAEGGLEGAGFNGRVELTGEQVRIDQVVGRLPQLGGAQVRLSGRSGRGEASPLAVRCNIRGLRFPFDCDDSEVGRSLQKFHRDYAPNGAMDVEVSVDRAAGGKLRWSGAARPRGMAMMVGYFPLPVSDLTGEVVVDGRRVMLKNLRGRGGEADVAVDGWVGLGDGHPMDISIAVADCPDGKTVTDVMARSTLPSIRGSIRRATKRFAPIGTCGVDVRVFAEDGGAVDAEVELTLDGRISGCFDKFPYRLSELTGRVMIRDDDVSIEHVRGVHGAARVELNGEALDLDEERPEVRIEVDARDAALDDDLAAALEAADPAARRAYDSLGLGGLADIAGVVGLQRDDGALAYDLTATLKKASLRCEAFPYALADVDGAVRLTGAAVEIERFAGRHGEGRIAVTGSIDLSGAEPEPDLVIDAVGVSLDEAFREAVLAAAPDGVAEVWDQLQPAGVADIRYILRPDDAAAGEAFPLTVTARGAQVTCRAFPYAIDGLRGVIAVGPERVELRNLTAGTKAAPITLAGQLQLDDGAVAAADLCFTALNIPLDKRLRAAAPAWLTPVTDRLGPAGTCDVDLPKLIYRRRPASAAADGQAPPADPAASWPWRVEGEVRLHRAAMEAGVQATEIEGRLAGSVTADPTAGAFAIDADLTADSLRLWGRRARGLTGGVHKKASEPTLRFENLVAEIYGGRMGGNVEVDLGETTRCGLTLNVENVELADLLNANIADPSKRAEGSGKVAGRLSMRIVGGDAPSRRGSGRFVLSRGRIAKVPLLLGVVKVILLELPTESSFSRGEVEYHLEDDTLTCSRIHLIGGGKSVLTLGDAGTSVVGAGKVDLAAEMVDLAFRSGPPHLLTGVFGDLWSKTASRLTTTHVTGPWRNPKTETVTLNSIQNLLGEVLGRRR